jgi:hypothetical protein
VNGSRSGAESDYLATLPASGDGFDLSTDDVRGSHRPVCGL